MPPPYVHTGITLHKHIVKGFAVKVHLLKPLVPEFMGYLCWGSSGFFFHSRTTASRAINEAKRHSSTLTLYGKWEGDNHHTFRDVDPRFAVGFEIIEVTKTYMET